jgi:hypothetical protein
MYFNLKCSKCLKMLKLLYLLPVLQSSQLTTCANELFVNTHPYHLREDAKLATERERKEVLRTWRHPGSIGASREHRGTHGPVSSMYQ